MAFTGCCTGKRTMEIRDNGKMVTIFVNLETGKAARVVAKMNKKKPADVPGEKPDMANAPAEELFTIFNIEVSLRPEDMPGKLLRPLFCTRCGQIIKDGRKIEHQNELFREPCFKKTDYYRLLICRSLDRI
jgi:formylmethanofuran dehydrogenase subunit E